MIEEKTGRKYPKVIWFPRSKTDLREFREVLKIAQQIQKENKDSCFNDKLLGQKMAEIGLINRVGMHPQEYIKSYKGKSTGDISYITNARMLIRIFRFLGWIRKIKSAKYSLTKRGEFHSQFKGEFPDIYENFNEENSILNSLKDFAFYSVNDTIENRDRKFKIRPFIWLLYNLSLEPQCISQLIVTCFASQKESKEEIQRIKNILSNLKERKTDLKKEFKRLGLDADDYSCVHNFYDSAKILVYLGGKLGLIEKVNNHLYGKLISGNAKYLKQASIFYNLTEKGKKYLNQNKDTRLVYFDEIEKINKERAKEVALFLAILNFELGNRSVASISKDYLEKLFEVKVKEYLKILSKINIKIYFKDGRLYLKDKISFNYWQSVPYEIISPKIEEIMETFYEDFIKKNKKIEFDEVKSLSKELKNVSNKFILNKKTFYEIPILKTNEDKITYSSYSKESDIYGGQDRYATRISPTNSVLILNGEVKIDNDSDCLDLLVALRNSDNRLTKFIDENIKNIMDIFIERTSEWDKDQHYVWVRNCFRLFGCKAIYSGSSGMLMRADVSILEPFLAGIEAKSPRENRGSVTSKAIRQADHARKQLSSLYKGKKLKTVAVAIGRRITPQAIKEEKEVFRPNGSPVTIISDRFLYYLSLRFNKLNVRKEDIFDLVTNYPGHFTKKEFIIFLQSIKRRGRIDDKVFNELIKEIEKLKLDTD